MKKLIIFLSILIIATTGCGNSVKKEETKPVELQKEETKPLEENIIEEKKEIEEEKEEVKEVETVENTEEDIKPEAIVETTKEKEFDINEYSEQEGKEVEDKVLKDKLTENLEHLFFNYCFRNNIEEDGNITPVAMVTSSISYIMQYEFSELKFDYETYILSIPKEQVKTIVYKFFGKKLIDEDYEICDVDNIEYDSKNELYKAKVQDGTFDTEIKIKKIISYNDECFKVEAKEKDVNITAYFQKIDLNYVLVNYKED